VGYWFEKERSRFIYLYIDQEIYDLYFLLRANYERHRVLLFSIEKSVEIRVTKENNFFLYWVDSSFTFLFARNKSSGTIQQADCKCEEIPGNCAILQLLAPRENSYED